VPDKTDFILSMAVATAFAVLWIAYGMVTA
jgi:hypothetical protein